MYNKVLLIGNLTRDVELRYTQSGTAIGKFGLATNRKWKDRTTGEDREEVMFVDVSVFGRSAEIANQYLAKGRRVFVEGRLVLDRWTDQNGQPRSKHSINADTVQFLDSKGSGGPGGGQQDEYGSNQGGGYGNDYEGGGYAAPSTPPPAQSAQPPRRPTPPQVDITDDEIPF